MIFNIKTKIKNFMDSATEPLIPVVDNNEPIYVINITDSNSLVGNEDIIEMHEKIANFTDTGYNKYIAEQFAENNIPECMSEFILTDAKQNDMIPYKITDNECYYIRAHSSNENCPVKARSVLYLTLNRPVLLEMGIKDIYIMDHHTWYSSQQ